MWVLHPPRLRRPCCFYRHLSSGFNRVCAPPSFACYLEKFCPVASLGYTPKTSGRTGGSSVTGTERGHETGTSRTLHMNYTLILSLLCTYFSSSISVSSGSLSAPIIYLRTGELRQALSCFHFTSASPDSF